MNLPSVAVLEELHPGLIGLINTDKTTDAQVKNCLQLILCSLRLWIIRESLYNNNSELYIFLEESFKLADWKKDFFNKFSQIEEQTIEDFLLLESSSEQPKIWQAKLQDRYGLNDSQAETLISSKLFNITTRTLNNDFQRLLKDLKLLEKAENKYKKIDNFEKLENEIKEEKYLNSNFLDAFDVELSTTAEQLNSEINGIQRLYIHTDYIVKGEAQDKVGELIETLKNTWSENNLFLIKFTYDSASLYRHVTCIVYPICIRYIRRALYLSAYGQISASKQKLSRKNYLSYKNYRLDRISNLEIIDWNSSEVPDTLRQELSKHQPEKYSLEYIINNSAEALGSDFYQPMATMLLRFPDYFHELYIENTLRHETFKLVNIKEPKSLKKLFDELKLDTLEREKLQTRMKLFPDDAYYKLNYRVDDNDVIMRLRAWGANVEVLFPQNLRDRIIKDISETYAIYQ